MMNINDLKDIFYISEVLNKVKRGWLECWLDTEEIVELCYSTRVALLEHKRKEKIYILEGSYKDHVGIIDYLSPTNKLSYLSNKIVISNWVNILFDMSKSDLYVERLGHFRAVSERTTLPKGIYRLKIPDAKIKKNLNKDYFNEDKLGSRFADTWIRMIPEIGSLGEYFLHYGTYSRGCVTVMLNRNHIWNEIYMHLMRSRLDNEYLGILKVV